jgi:hypothetical protein
VPRCHCLHFIKIASMDGPDVEGWLGCRGSRARRIRFHQICLSCTSSSHGGSRCPGHGNTWAQNLLSHQSLLVPSKLGYARVETQHEPLVTVQAFILIIETFNLHFVSNCIGRL